ncbi:MAG TPA: phosphate ABC transporter permease subunit PstC [Acidimicrobiales bacterium]|nr:phosphate ABC transporter permease subunit PstC [Acidimicrobiales bacterium]
MSTDTLASPAVGHAVPRPITVPNDRSKEDRIFRAVARAAGFTAFAILFLIGFFLLWRGLPALRAMGFRYFTTSGYSTLHKPYHFGALAQMYGTIVTSLVAVIFGVPVAIGTALFINEYAPIQAKRALIAMVDLGAAIPSIIFGLWALHQFQPEITGTTSWMVRHLSFIPLFSASTPPFNGSFFIAGLIVGLMIVPIVASVSREVFSLAPPGEREGALALGATKSQMIRTVVLPFGRGGIIGASMLGLGRALGETIAVYVLLGLDFVISPHILEHGGTTVASFIAAEFGAGGKLGTDDLLMLGFVLFTFTLIVNLIASLIVNRSRSGKGVEL